MHTPGHVHCLVHADMPAWGHIPVCQSAGCTDGHMPTHYRVHSGGPNIHNGRYLYTEELLALEATSVRSRHCNTGSPPHIARFLPFSTWFHYIEQHLDKAVVAFMEQGFLHGFRIRFHHAFTLRPAPPNFHSVQANLATVEGYIHVAGKVGHTLKRTLLK